MILWLIGIYSGAIGFINPEWVPEVKTEIRIEISWFPKQSLANDISTIFYNSGWLDMVTTMIGENWWFNKDIVSITNDHWLCQLNYKRHKDFINSPEFKDPYNQARYCTEVWKDAIKKNRLSTTFYAYNHRSIYKKRVSVLTRHYYQIFNKRFYTDKN